MWRKNWLDAGIYFDADRGDGGNGNGDGKPPDDQKPPEQKFTQADLDRILGERLKRAEETTQKQLLDALGVANTDEAKKAIEDAKKLREQQMSDLEKAKAEADELKAAKEKAERERMEAIEKATQTLMRAAVLTEASKPEYRFKPDALSDVWTFVDRSGIKPKENADGEFTGIVEALKELAKTKAYLVEAGDGHGTPRPGARSRSGATDLSKEAQEQARRMTRRNF